jgi:hypothetical protein
LPAVLIFLSCSTFTPVDFGNLILDLPRHDSFQYINQEAIPEEYFAAAFNYLDDPYIYLVLSDTGSPASKLISIFTNSPYNHVSLSFDEELLTMVSYNGGNGRNNPGLNSEEIKDFMQKPDASFAVYKLKAERLQQAALLNRIDQINREGSSYNLLGLFTKRSYQPNIMFCSQFVYTLLNEVGLGYFEKDTLHVTPMDFLELDEENSLVFIRIDRP